MSKIKKSIAKKHRKVFIERWLNDNFSYFWISRVNIVRMNFGMPLWCTLSIWWMTIPPLCLYSPPPSPDRSHPFSISLSLSKCDEFPVRRLPSSANSGFNDSRIDRRRVWCNGLRSKKAMIREYLKQVVNTDKDRKIWLRVYWRQTFD